MSRMLTELDPTYEQFKDEKGCIVVRLDRALYACVESASLWYEHLVGTLNRLGYIKNEYDKCVSNTVLEGRVQVTITIHVDDLFATCTD